MTDTHLKRRKHLGRILQEAKLGAAAFVPGPNFFYLTGLDFHLMERPTLLIVTAGGEILAIMPELERLKWEENFSFARTFYWQDSTSFHEAFEDASAALGNIAIGIEGGRMRAFEVEALRENLGQGLVQDADYALTELRLSKDREELDAIEKAISISEAALGDVIDVIKTGMSEREISGILKMKMLANGADGFAFDPIVLAGGKSANPHGVPGDVPLRPGDSLLIDFGARADNYSADITRTFFCEYVTDEHAEIYKTVLAANEKGRAIASPKLSAHDLDEMVTEVLSRSSYSELIVHKTGHGLGLDVHEAPQVMVGNHWQLVDGCLLTIEPGLYRPNEIGVRIEDDVLITQDGNRSLTSFSRDLTIVGG